MCIGLVGRKHSVLKTVLACLYLRRNLHVLLHGMGNSRCGFGSHWCYALLCFGNIGGEV